jgi:hypothetical protein
MFVIEKVVEQWHSYISGNLPGGLDELLADDVVFYSPVVYTPQKGKDITKLYLSAAGSTFGGDDARGASRNGTGSKSKSDSSDGGGFRYTKQLLSGNQAALEFETTLGGKYINGIDIITCNAEGKIIEFRVMIRPLQAVNMLHERMGAMLEKMKS